MSSRAATVVVALFAVALAACGSPQPVSDDRGIAAETPVAATAAPTDAELACTKATGLDGGRGPNRNPALEDNRPITAELCVSNASPRVGERVTFSVTAEDPDARLFGVHECLPNALRFGDEEQLCRMVPGCTRREGPPPRAVRGTVAEERPHMYAEPGDYTATLRLQSGSQCPHPYGNKIEVSVDIHVRA